MQNSHRVPLSTDDENQVLNIPHEFALSGTEVLLGKEGRCLVVEPILISTSLLALLATLPDIPEEFPDSDIGLL